MSTYTVQISEHTTFNSNTSIDETTLDTLSRGDVIRVEAEGESTLNVTIDVRSLDCAFYVRGSPDVNVKIIHDDTQLISSRFAFANNVVSVEFVDEANVSVDPSGFVSLVAGDFDWDSITGGGLIAPTEKTLHDSRTHFFVAGSIPGVLDSCMTLGGLVFAAGVHLDGLTINLNEVRLADLQNADEYVSRCHVNNGSVTFVKASSGESKVPLEVFDQASITVQPPVSGSANLEIIFAAPGETNKPALDLVANSSFKIKNSLRDETEVSNISQLTVQAGTGVVVTLDGMSLLVASAGSVVGGAGAIHYINGKISSQNSATRALFRVEDTAIVEFISTGESEDNSLWVSQLHLRMSKGADVSFEGVDITSPYDQDQTESLATATLANEGRFCLILDSPDVPDPGNEIVVTFKNKPSHLIVDSPFVNGLLVDSLGERVPIRLSTPAGGGLRTRRTFPVNGETTLSNVGVLFRDSAHYDAMDIDGADLSNTDGSGTYGSLVFGTQATCVDAVGNLNFHQILKQRKSGSSPIWISRARHVMTSWRTDEPMVFQRAWNSDQTLRVLKDSQNQDMSMRLDAAFAVGLDSGTAFTGKDGNLDLRLEVLSSQFQLSGSTSDAQAEILTNVQKSLFGDVDEDVLPHTGVCGYFNSSKLGAETLRVWDADPSTEFTVFFETDDGIEFENPDGTTSKRFVFTGTNVYAVTFDDPKGKVLLDDLAHKIPRLAYIIVDDPSDATVQVYEERKNEIDTLVWVPAAATGSIDHQEQKLRAALLNYMILWPSNMFLGRAPSSTDPNWSNNSLLDDLLVRKASSYAPLTENNLISLSPQAVHTGVNVYFTSDVFWIRHSSNVTETGWQNGETTTLSLQISGIPKIADDTTILRDEDTHVLVTPEGAHLPSEFPWTLLQRTADVSLVLAKPNVMLVKGGIFENAKSISGNFIGTDGDYANYFDPDLLHPHEAVEFRPEDYTYIDNSDSINIDIQEAKMQKNKLTTREDFELALSMFIKARTTGERLNDNLLDPDDNSWLSGALASNTNAQLFLVVPDNMNTSRVISELNHESVNSFIENQTPTAPETKTLWDVTGLGASKVQVKWHTSRNATYQDGEYSLLIVSNELLGDATNDQPATAATFKIRPRTVDGLCKMQYQTIGNVLRAMFHVVPLLKSSIQGLETSPATFAVYSRIPLLMHVRAHDFANQGEVSVSYGPPDTFNNTRYTFMKNTSMGLLEVQFIAMPEVEDDQETPSFNFELVTMSGFTSTVSQFSIQPKISGDTQLISNPDRMFINGSEILGTNPHVFNKTLRDDRRLLVGGLDATANGVNGRRTYRIRTVWTEQDDPNPNRNFLLRIHSVDRLVFDSDDNPELQTVQIADTLTERKKYAFNEDEKYSSAVINWTTNLGDWGGTNIMDVDVVSVTYAFQSQISSYSRGGGPATSIDNSIMRQSIISETIATDQPFQFVHADLELTITNPPEGGQLQRSLASVSERIWVGICPINSVSSTANTPAHLLFSLYPVIFGLNLQGQEYATVGKVYTTYDGTQEITHDSPLEIDPSDQLKWIGGWVDFSEVVAEFSSITYADIEAWIRTKAGTSPSIFQNEQSTRLNIGRIDLSEAGNLSLTANVDGIEFSHIRLGNWIIKPDSAGDLGFRHRVFADEHEGAVAVDSTIQARVSASSVAALQSSMDLPTPGAVSVVATEFRLTGHPNDS